MAMPFVGLAFGFGHEVTGEVAVGGGEHTEEVRPSREVC